MTSVEGASPHPFRAAAERDDGLLRLVSEALEGWRCVTELQGSDAEIGFVFLAPGRAGAGDRPEG